MASKYELTISSDYVPDWTYVEAIREIFQNALDNETINPDNRMFVEYKNNTLKIGNKTSILQLDTLLLGSSTKRDNVNTIGKHGEGYKVGFMVLLREGKTIVVHNYGNREIWEAKLVKSKRFNNSLIPVITVNKKAMWQKVPDSNLVVEIQGITPEEYQAIVTKNLHLQDEVAGIETSNGMGTILLDDKYKGSLFVNGLYVCTDPNLRYGYNISPKYIKLDRDRRLVNTIDIVWETSKMWRHVDRPDLVSSMLVSDAVDIKYIKNRKETSHTSTPSEAETFDSTVSNVLVIDFQKKHGKDAIPVSTNFELDRVRKEYPSRRPVLVSDTAYSYLSSKLEPPSLTKLTPKQRLTNWLGNIRYRLSTEEIAEFRAILEDMN